MGSGPGIASMILGIVASIIFWIIVPTLLFIFIGIINLPLSYIGVLLRGFAFFLAILGLILGIVGATTDEKKAFSIIGLILCAVILLFAFFLL